MKKLCVIAAAGLMAASTLLAVEIGDEGKIITGSSLGIYQPGGGWGGEFTLTPTDGWLDVGAYANDNVSYGISSSGDTTFQTFCLETHEYIEAKKSYDAVVASMAYKGGKENGDPISVGTSWLYSLFVTGDLDKYAYKEGEDARIESAKKLQEAIWWLEEENYNNTTTPYSSDSENPFIAVVMAEYKDEAEARKDADPSETGVYVLQLKLGNDLAQDVLYYQTPSQHGGGVPDGGFTLLLLGSAMAGLSVVRRKLG